MFTGIIKHTISIERIKRDQGKISIHIQLPFNALEGDSISVNGVCLTVESMAGRTAVLQAVSETINNTNLSTLKPGNPVNIEPSLKIGDTIDGHLVYGHVDGTGKIKEIKRESSNIYIEIGYPHELKKFIAKKGSIAVDGISLTVADITNNEFKIAVIPYTFNNTNLQHRKRGDIVNLEIDPLSRYIERIREAK